MLDKAIQVEPRAFADFDRTKNVQDQLQAMIEERPCPGLFLRFVTFMGWDGATWDVHSYPNWGIPHRFFGSMEQLWLGFLMHEKYQKRWAGEDWE